MYESKQKIERTQRMDDRSTIRWRLLLFIRFLLGWCRAAKLSPAAFVFAHLSFVFSPLPFLVSHLLPGEKKEPSPCSKKGGVRT